MESQSRNQKLIAARQEKRWSQEQAAAEIGVERKTYLRWENGQSSPQPGTLDLACRAFGLSAAELGFRNETPEALEHELLASEAQASSTHPLQAFTLTEGHLAAFASLLRLGETIMFDPARRKTLEMLLMALSLAVVKPESFLQPEAFKHILEPETDLARINEVTIQGYAKIIEACWQLLKGNEMASAENLLPECMTKLVSIAQQPSKYQQTAANLVTQGYRIYGILALHRNDLEARELYYEQAVKYGQIAGDTNSIVTSLKGLAGTYYYSNQYPKLLQADLYALQYTKEASPLLQSSVHMGLAQAYAHMDQRQDALTSLGMAIDTFPDHPETDPSFSFANFDLPWLIMGEGVTRSKLGQTKQALETFSRIEQPGILVPERVRLEVINHRARAALFSGDLEQGCVYVESGITGAKALGSQRRLNEAYDNYKQMAILWPMETQVKKLGELLYA